MTMLVTELKKDHAAIAEALASAKRLGIISPQGREKLSEAKARLLAHLRREDEELYPVLRKAAGQNGDLKRLMDNFAGDMAAISQAALGFFGKYSNGGDDIEFATDFGRLLATLNDRISREENILYTQYEKLKR